MVSTVDAALGVRHRARIDLGPGLSETQLAEVERRFGLRFNPDHADLLKRTIPRGTGWSIGLEIRTSGFPPGQEPTAQFKAHRSLPLDTRHVIEVPMFHDSERSQWTQMADLDGFCWIILSAEVTGPVIPQARNLSIRMIEQNPTSEPRRSRDRHDTPGIYTRYVLDGGRDPFFDVAVLGVLGPGHEAAPDETPAGSQHRASNTALRVPEIKIRFPQPLPLPP